MTPIEGVIISLTKDETILPKAAPTIMPTTISTTLPLIAKSLSSDNIPTTVFPIKIKNQKHRFSFKNRV